MNILWDFDGTLLDTYPVYTEILYRVLDRQVKREEIYEQLKISFGHAFSRFQLNDKQLSAFKTLEGAIKPEQVMPFEGVEEVLKSASLNVIMTHKDRKSVEAFLSYYGLAGYFSEIVTVEDGFPRKPDPASYKYLHDKYRLDLAVGDRELDLIPANLLGIRTCKFQGQSEIADFKINHYKEFLQKVKI